MILRKGDEMPIFEDDKGNIKIEYVLPKELEILITKEFSTIFIDEIKKVFSCANNEYDIIGILYMNAGSSGTHVAFVNTCIKLGLNNFIEASKLNWYDYDLFMDIILNKVGEIFYGKEKYKKTCMVLEY